MGFSRQEYWSGLPFPPEEDLLKPGIESYLLLGKVDSLLLSYLRSPLSVTVARFIALGIETRNLFVTSPRRASMNTGLHKDKGRAGSCSRMRHKAISYIFNLSIDI